AISFRVRHDEAQVGFDEARHRGFVAVAADPRAERPLFLGAQTRELRDLAEVRSERARIIAGRKPLRHAASIHQYGNRKLNSDFSVLYLRIDAAIEPGQSGRI